MNTASLKNILVSPFLLATGWTKRVLRLLSWWLLVPAAWLGQTVQAQAQCGSNITVTITLTAGQLNGSYTVSLGGSSASLSGMDQIGRAHV